MGLRHPLPVAATPLWLCKVRAQADGGEVNHGLIALIPLVGDNLVEGLRRSQGGLRIFNLLVWRHMNWSRLLQSEAEQAAALTAIVERVELKSEGMTVSIKLLESAGGKIPH